MQPAHLYCFQVDYKVNLTFPRAPGRTVFLGRYTPTALGLGNIDLECQQQAQGLPVGGTGMWKAFLGTSTAAAISRFDVTKGPWVRPDGVQVVITAADLNSATPHLYAPIDQYADGTYAGPYNVFTGGGDPTSGSTTTQDCKDWSSVSNTDVGFGATANRTDPSFFGPGSGLPCDYTNGHMYCLEQ